MSSDAQVMEQQVPSEVSAGIYGTIICASVMVAAENFPVGEVALSVIVTVLVYWIAERWSEIVARQLYGQPFSWRLAIAVLRHGWPMVQASYTPLIVMGAAWLFGATDALAITIAVWVTIGLLGLLGAQAGRRAGLSRWGVVGSAGVTALLGAGLVVLKGILH